MNLIEASIKGGNSVTAILFRRYVEPQMTYTEKKASITKTGFGALLIYVSESNNLQY